jgi:uncharacterized protein
MILQESVPRLDSTAMWAAVRGGDDLEVSDLIKDGIDLNAQNENGLTFLFSAVYFLKEKIVKILVEAGANVNVREKDGRMPLHWCLKNSIAGMDKEKAKIVQILVNGGADVNSHDLSGRTPLDYAYIMEEKECIKLLKNCGAKHGQNSIKNKRRSWWKFWMKADTRYFFWGRDNHWNEKLR